MTGVFLDKQIGQQHESGSISWVRDEAKILEILMNGLIQSDEQVMGLAERYRQLVLPKDYEDLELTHWWLIRENVTEVLYVGTPETFATYIKEEDHGVGD